MRAVTCRTLLAGALVLSTLALDGTALAASPGSGSGSGQGGSPGAGSGGTPPSLIKPPASNLCNTSPIGSPNNPVFERHCVGR